MIEFETPPVLGVKTVKVAFDAEGLDGPELTYTLKYGREENSAFIEAYSKSGRVVGENVGLFIQTFLAQEGTLIGFLAQIGEIPSVVIELK